MSKIYINPLNLGAVLIDTEDFSQCEVDNVPSLCEVWKLPRTKEWRENISKALKGKKPKNCEANLKKMIILNTGKKRPEHSKLMKNKYKNGELFMPRGQAKGKRSKKSRKNMSDSIAKLRKKIVSCVKCHKLTDGSMFEGVWMAHFANHHRSC